MGERTSVWKIYRLSTVPRRRHRDQHHAKSIRYRPRPPPHREDPTLTTVNGLPPAQPPIPHHFLVPCRAHRLCLT